MRLRRIFAAATFGSALLARGPAFGAESAPDQYAERLTERAHQDRTIVYFLRDPDSHSFDLYHDYTETKTGEDRYVNVVRKGSRASKPSARVLDTGEDLKVETLRGEEIRKAGLDKPLEKKLVMARDVRECLMYAERGEVDGAFVYKTDALMAKQARILFSVPQELYPRVTYPMALTVSGHKNKDAEAFYRYLRSAEAKAVLARYGFTTK